MALTQAGLKSVLKANIIAIYGQGQNPDDDTTLDRFCDAVAKSVVDYIHSNADIELQPGDVPVQVSLVNGIGANTTHPALTMRIK